MMDFMPEAQTLFTVVAGVERGRPARGRANSDQVNELHGGEGKNISMKSPPKIKKTKSVDLLRPLKILGKC